MKPFATIGAGCLLIENESVLLVQPNYGRAKGSWILPGGFIEPGETPIEGALRELKEETGQEAKFVSAFCVRHRKEPADVYWVFRVDKTRTLPVVPQPDELMAAKYWPLNEVVNNEQVRPMTRYFIENLVRIDRKNILLPQGFAETDTVFFFD